MTPQTLAPLTHDCKRCGGICHGSEVRVEPHEQTSLEAIARQFGVTEPVVDGKLRHTNGHCVFLGENKLCRIHGELGMEAKPLVCQQFPLVGIRTASDVRLGIDPGCLHAWQQSEDDPEIELGRTAVSAVPLDASLEQEEAALLNLLAPPGDLAGALQQIAQTTELIALRDRLIEHCIRVQLPARIRHPDTAPLLARLLEPVCIRIEGGVGGPLEIGDRMSPWSVEAARRGVWLRKPADAAPLERAVIVLFGALMVASSGLRAADQGPALAAWTRIFRTPLHRFVFPDRRFVIALLTGRS